MAFVYEFPGIDRFRRRSIELHFEFMAARGSPIPKGGTVLDFGCGIGDSVTALLEMGYDAYGVDILEFWGRDINRWWLKKEPPPSTVRKRLFCVNQSPYQLPFENDIFDFCFSDEVFEHVSNHVCCFSEIARVLKPNATSLHRFPGPNSLLEAHIRFPLAGLCHWRPWIVMCAYLGFRPLSGKEWNAREAVIHCLEWMKSVNYPSKPRLRQYAREANVAVDFLERQDFRSRDVGTFARIRHAADSLRLGTVAVLLMPIFAQRYMALRPIRGL